MSTEERRLIMKSKILFALCISFSLIFNGCSMPTVYLAPSGQQIANQHQILGIVPSSITIKKGRKKNPKELLKQQVKIGEEFQEEIYEYLLKRKSRGQMVIDVQNIDSTNIILSKNKINLSETTTDVLCELLNVDAVIYSEFVVPKPQSFFTSLLSIMIFDSYSPDTEINMSLSIKDCDEKTLIWKYDDEESEGIIFSSQKSIILRLLRNATREMPYFKDN